MRRGFFRIQGKVSERKPSESKDAQLGMEDRLGSPLGIAGFWTLGMEDRLGSPLGIAGFEPHFFFT